MLETIDHELVFATSKDCDLLFEWINDTDVRANSFNSDLIKYEDHIIWFSNTLRSKKSHIYIFKADKQNVGLIRIDLIEDTYENYLISYSIAKNYRRKGYGTILLEMIKEKYKSSILIGKVKKDNIGSIKSFMKAGYIMKEETDTYVFYSYDLR